MKKQVTKKAVHKIEAVSKYIPTTEVIDLFNNLVTAYRDDQKVKVEISKIDAQKELLIKEMENKYDLYHKVFDQIFEERSKAVDKSFDIIDKGLKENDKELISTGLSSLSEIVSSSPFGNLSDLSKMLEGNKIIEI